MKPASSQLSLRSISLIACALSLGGALGSGCGNDLQTQIPTALAETYAPPDPLQAGFDNGVDPITGDSQANVTNYACPASNNVMPDYDWLLNGTGNYTVCPARANTTDILVHGIPAVGNVLCIFPAESSDPLDVALIRDTTTGLPLFQCVQITSTGAYASFPVADTYNAAYIVDLNDVTQMQTCLAQGNYYLCPHNYSYGLFRN